MPLTLAAAVTFFGSGSVGADEKKITQRKSPPPEQSLQDAPSKKISRINALMHYCNPSLTSSLPSIAAEFYEGGFLIDKNFVKHREDINSTIDALRYDNADAWSRPWAGLTVHLGGLVARYPGNFLASLFTNSIKLQSRVASMISYYTIVGEVRYLRNPILGILQDTVKQELDTDPGLYQNDPRNIPLITIIANLCKKRRALDSEINHASKQEINIMRSALDALILSMSMVVGVNLGGGAGRAVAGPLGSGYVIRDIIAKEKTKNIDDSELRKLRDRSRSEMITWPSVFACNAILQSLVATFLPQLFPEDDLAQDHFREMVGNLGQAVVYSTAKTRAQSALEKASEQNRLQNLWHIVDWYIKP